MLRNKKFIIGAIIIFAAIGVLSYRALAGSATYYYELAELTRNQSSLSGETVKVRGLVQEGSVERITQGAVLKFTMTDESLANRLSVVYQGVVPDTFQEGREVVCEGSLGPDRIFKATVLMPKCPSKYTPVAE